MKARGPRLDPWRLAAIALAALVVVALGMGFVAVGVLVWKWG